MSASADRHTPNNEHNRSVYERRSIVAQYTDNLTITAAEETIFRRYRDHISGKQVLDLGVGGGRTSARLAPEASSYVGMDFSQAMVDACQERYPQWNFRWGDARNLREFADASLDFVLFSFNGIDSVGHQDRLAILQEVFRILRPGGVYAFSSHNLDSVGHGTFLAHAVRVPVTANPVRLAKGVVRAGRHIFNYARNARLQHRAADHAILTDPAHGFALRHYYIRAADQKRQLVASGFSPAVDVLNGVDNMAVPYFLYYVARKPE